MGDLTRALKLTRKSVELADTSDDRFNRMASLTTLADTLHQAGRTEEAAAAFQEAEEMQKQWQPDCPFLYSVWGFRYCDLLLAQEQTRQVKNSATRTLEL